MERRFTVLMVAGLYLAVAACCLPQPTPTSSPGAVKAQETVDAMAALTHDLPFPGHFQSGDAARTGDEFDVNKYFAVLQHLSMEPGYVLDYVYQIDSLGGLPILYARRTDEPAYRTLAEYSEARGQGASGSYLDHIQIDGTPEGFFQFVVLRIMGGQFYLYWHANYNDAQILCDRAALEALLSRPTMFEQELPGDVQRAARKLDVEPVIEMGAEMVIVRVVVFTNWGGFVRQSVTVGRGSPHQILEQEAETLVPYNCNVMF